MKEKLQKNEERLRQVQMVLGKLYEDSLAGKISEELFITMGDAYQAEIKELTEETTLLRE